MFHKTIVELQKIRKFVDCRMAETSEDPLISQALDDVSYQITIVIQDLVRVDKTLFQRKKDDNATIHTNQDLRKE